MVLRSVASKAITGVLVLTAIIALGSIAFGYPPPISYVETDSMEPQLEPNDGFIGVPRPLAGDISTGDVVTYRAKRIGGGGLTTHRIIDRTETGYITKGDNNGFNDTAAGEPPVTRAQIELVAVQYQGKLVVIPHIGDITVAIRAGLTAVLSALGLRNIQATNPGVLVAVVGLVLVVGVEGYNAVTNDTSRTTRRTISDRDRVDSRLILIGVLVVVSLPLFSVMVLPSGTTDMGVLATEAPDPDNPARVAPGAVSETTIPFQNDQPIPLVIVVDPATEGVSIADRVLVASPGEKVTTTISVRAPTEIGWAVRARTTQYYLPVLPPSVIGWLHSLHPFIALTAVFSIIWLPIAVLYWLFIGFGYIKLRDVH